jgi:predicted DNA-binding transcriptional regulator YafY
MKSGAPARTTSPPTPTKSTRPSVRARKGVGRPEGSFTQHRRLDRMREALENTPGGLPLDALANVAEASVRSVRRYLHELSRIVDLESIPVSKGGIHLWRLKPGERGRTLFVRRTQAYSLLALRPIFELVRGSAFHVELDVLMRQLLQVAQRPVRTSTTASIPTDQRLEDRLLFVPGALRKYTTLAEDFDRVLQATAEMRVLTFHLAGAPGAPPVRTRTTAHPYAMVVHKGTFFVLAAAPGNPEVRALPLHRMSEVVATEARFLLPPDFEASAYLQGEFSPAANAPRPRVVVEFDARVADEVKTRRFHPAQKIAVAKDGRVRLTFPLVSLEETRAWVLGFGDAALVVEPAELAAEVAATLARALARYAPPA